MYDIGKWEEVRNNRRESKESRHFIVHYNLRNPVDGRGDASGGVRDEKQIDVYLEALEKLYDVMTQPPWSRPPPIVGEEGKTIVYVFDLSEVFTDGNDDAVTIVDKRRIPFVCLSARSLEATLEAEQELARAQAAHEATHVFNCRERHLGDYVTTEPWRWMHEAMAVYMETVVFTDNSDFHRFTGQWVIRPEVSLDGWNGHYQASMFLRYLGEQFGPEIINKIWTTSGETEQPLHAIERILMEVVGRKFCSPSPEEDDAFASGYCMDSYFLQDATVSRHACDVFTRHGDRSITETLRLSVDRPIQVKDRVDHLACRYYRLYPRSAVTRIEVQILAEANPVGTTLKAEMAVVTKRMQRGPIHKLTARSDSDIPDGSVALYGEIPKFDVDDMDHIVLVIANCGFRGKEQYSEHDDDRQYTITATAH